MALAINSGNPLGIHLSLAQCRLIVSRDFRVAVQGITYEDLQHVNPCTFRGLKAFLTESAQLDDPDTAEEVMVIM